MTPGCTVQACGIRDRRAAFAELGVVVLGISPDPVSRLANLPSGTHSISICCPTRITPSPSVTGCGA